MEPTESAIQAGIQLVHAKADLNSRRDENGELRHVAPLTAITAHCSFEQHPRMPIVVSCRLSSIENVAILPHIHYMLRQMVQGCQPEVVEETHEKLHHDILQVGHHLHHHEATGESKKEQKEREAQSRLIDASASYLPKYGTIRFSFQNSMAETATFPLPLVTNSGDSKCQVGINETLRLPGRVFADPHHPGNILSVELVVYDNFTASDSEAPVGSTGHVIGSVHIHLHDLSRARRVPSAPFDIYSGDSVVAHLRAGFTLCYGSFGYGHGAILQQNKKSIALNVQHSLYPRVRPPAGRFDPVRFTMAPSVQRMPSIIYARPALIGLHRELARVYCEQKEQKTEEVDAGDALQDWHDVVEGSPAQYAADVAELSIKAPPSPEFMAAEEHYEGSESVVVDAQESSSKMTSPDSSLEGARPDADLQAPPGVTVDVDESNSVLEPLQETSAEDEALDSDTSARSGFSAASAMIDQLDLLPEIAQIDQAEVEEVPRYTVPVLPDEDLFKYFVRDVHVEYPLAVSRMYSVVRAGRERLDELLELDQTKMMPTPDSRRSKLRFLWQRVHGLTASAAPLAPGTDAGRGAQTQIGESNIGWQRYMHTAH